MDVEKAKMAKGLLEAIDRNNDLADFFNVNGVKDVKINIVYADSEHGMTERIKSIKYTSYGPKDSRELECLLHYILKGYADQNEALRKEIAKL